MLLLSTDVSMQLIIPGIMSEILWTDEGIWGPGFWVQ